MCYSILVKTNLKENLRELEALPDRESWEALYALRLENPTLKIPPGLDRGFVLSADPADKRLADVARRFHDEERARTAAQMRRTQERIRGLRGEAAAKEERALEKLRRKLGASFDQITPLDGRVFPGYFAPAIVARDRRRLLVPMRYRVRAPDGREVPYRYNVFNSRRDSLLRAPTWRPLFGHRHAIVPFQKFFEWVERDGKKREISFSPENRALMWAASLYSNTNAPGALPYRSFALVTDDPPPEVAAAGHDRCPVFLAQDRLDDWLEPAGKEKKFLLSLLDHKEKAFYLHDLVA